MTFFDPPRRKRHVGRNVFVGVAVVIGLFFAVGALGASTDGQDEPDFAGGATVAPRPVRTSEPPPTSRVEEPAESDGDESTNSTDVVPDDPADAWPSAVVTRVVDGDTIDVAGFGRVRIIGIDTPEHGECGFQHATDLMEYLVLGKEITLVPGARDDRDAYDRLLRYADVGGKDAGREMIRSGWATARYDSRDGYGTHPREADYVALDAQVPDKTCHAPAPAPAPARPAPAPPAAESWNSPGPDLDCADIGRRVRITGPDYHRLDADGDGWGCDSYG